MNPNNCKTCDHMRVTVDGLEVEGHCYMFRDEPKEVCMQHTGGQKVAFINHIPCRGNLTSLALLVANMAATEQDND